MQEDFAYWEADLVTASLFHLTRKTTLNQKAQNLSYSLLKGDDLFHWGSSLKFTLLDYNIFTMFSKFDLC